MTPEQLTGLACLILEFRDWLEAQEGQTLDTAVLGLTIELIVHARKALVQEGAR